MEEKKKQEEKKEEIPVRLLERKLRYKGSVLDVYEDTVLPNHEKPSVL